LFHFSAEDCDAGADHLEISGPGFAVEDREMDAGKALIDKGRIYGEIANLSGRAGSSVLNQRCYNSRGEFDEFHVFDPADVDCRFSTQVRTLFNEELYLSHWLTESKHRGL
jgi:hypothetical protein